MAVHPPKKPDLNVLPKIRPRALTLPLPLAQEAATKKKWTLPKLGSKFKQTAQDQITFEQEGCTIFTKLPREIRDMIWKECLGGSVLHFGFPDGKGRGYVACQNRVKPKNTSQLEEWASGNGCLISCWDGEGMTHGGSERHLLGLPLTCRRIYSEAIDYLYSENTFDLMDPFLLKSLPSIILPQRLNKIKSIQFLWALYFIPTSTDSTAAIELRNLWKDVWNVLRDMEGLKVLRVECFSGFELRTAAEREMIEDVKAVDRPEVFELRLMRSYTVGDLEAVMNPRCTIIRSNR